MKKFILSLALMALALPFTSCTNDEPIQDEPVKETLTCKGLINSTITIKSNTVNYIETADYIFNIEYTKDEATVSVIAQGVKFDSHMPVKVSFRMEDIKVKGFEENAIAFGAASVKFFNPETGEENTNYTLTDVRGYIDKKNEVFTLTYIVNGTWRVQVTSPTIRSYVANNDYTAPTETYYIYKIDIEKMKAEVFLHNVQFKVGGASSPVLKKISIPDLDVTPTATGFDLSGNNIVPYNYSGENLDQAIPMPPMVVTNFNSKIDIGYYVHTIFFNCMGGEWNDKSLLYLWWKTNTDDLTI